jgi:hypothetical protein
MIVHHNDRVGSVIELCGASTSELSQFIASMTTTRYFALAG